MQKKIIALAIAGLASTAAFAQSNVTIYGIADAYVAQTRASGNLTSTAVGSGGLSTSRIGFKGVEDLGNGLKALFVLEYRLDIDGNNTLGGSRNATSTVTPDNGDPIYTASAADAGGPARQQLVGLTGAFGTAVAGRLQTTAFDWQGKYQTLSATAFDVHNAMTKTGYRINLTNDSRANNAIAYISPSMGGVTVALNHSFAVEQASSATAGNLSATLVGVYYDNGPLSVGFVGEKLQGGGAGVCLPATATVGSTPTACENVERTDLALGASYDFKVVKLTAAYQTTKNNRATTADAGKFDAVGSIGAQIPVSAKGAVHVLYAQSNMKSSTHADDNNGKGISVAYTHALSKRTTAYAGFGYLDNSGAGTKYSFGGTPTAGGSSNVIAAGLRHSF